MEYVTYNADAETDGAGGGGGAVGISIMFAHLVIKGFFIREIFARKNLGVYVSANGMTDITDSERTLVASGGVAVR